MRWWLAAVFALIAALAALSVSELLSRSSEQAFRERAQQLAAGSAFESAIAVRRLAGPTDLRRADETAEFGRRVEALAAERRVALFVFDREGNLLTRPRSHGVELDSVADQRLAVRSALARNRFVRTNDTIRATVVAVPLSGRQTGALLAYASHPDLSAASGIVEHELVQAVLWAIVIGALAGIVVATLIANRLRRIATAAAAIEQGRFEVALQPRFRDELGELAWTLDRMRRRLLLSFTRLKSERDRLEGLLERLQEGVVTVDRGLEIDFANSEARRLLAAPGLEAGSPLPDPWPAVSLRALAAGLFEPGASVAEARVSVDEDVTYVVAGLPAPIESETAVIVVTDVSERERRERAEREFVTNAAHELRTPLTTLTGAVEALQAGAKEDPAHRDRFLTHIERESTRLARLVRSLLVLARAQTREEAPSLTTIDVRPLLEEVGAEMRPHEGVAVEIDCPSDLAAVAQRELLAQAVGNLAANAAAVTTRGRIVLRARPQGGSVSIEVEDTGPGIAPGEQERLFDRFYRGSKRDVEGFGIGLAIVRESVRALGGEVRIESSEGRGTTARIRLPAARAEAA